MRNREKLTIEVEVEDLTEDEQFELAVAMMQFARMYVRKKEREEDKPNKACNFQENLNRWGW